MRRLLLFTPLLSGLATGAGAQARGPRAVASPIQDNSFLVEEAYNQERGVVQHIGTFARTAESGDWLYTFTQEWPIAGQHHQVSYTLTVARAPAELEGASGIGDVALNYRYQVVGAVGGDGDEGEGGNGNGNGDGDGDGSGTTAFAPRITLLLPTGASDHGLGRGGVVVQVNLPLSVELPGPFVAHSNAGSSYAPRALDALGNSAAALDYTLAQSVIWLAHPRVNLMLEAAWTRAEQVSGPGRVERSTEALLSPGIRTAFDFASGLQIVPGLAFPFGVGPSRGERSVFVYLSLEHPFAGQAQLSRR